MHQLTVLFSLPSVCRTSVSYFPPLKIHFCTNNMDSKGPLLEPARAPGPSRYLLPIRLSVRLPHPWWLWDVLPVASGARRQWTKSFVKPLLFQEIFSAEVLGEVPFRHHTFEDRRSMMKPVMRAAAVGRKPAHSLSLVARCPCRCRRNLSLWFQQSVFKVTARPESAVGPGDTAGDLKVQMVSWTPAPSMDMLLFVPHVQHVLGLMVSIVVHGVYSSKSGERGSNSWPRTPTECVGLPVTRAGRLRGDITACRCLWVQLAPSAGQREGRRQQEEWWGPDGAHAAHVGSLDSLRTAGVWMRQAG